MGVTIHFRLGQKKEYVKKNLDRVEEFAKIIQRSQAKTLEIPFKVKRHGDYHLNIDIGGCETLCFYFKSYEKFEKEANGGWSYETATLPELS